MGHRKMTTATIHHKIISNEGKGADITNHVLTSMEYLKLKLPNVRTYVHTLPSCGSTDWSVYPSSLDLPGTQLQYSCLENPMDGEAWWAAVHGVAKGGTRLSGFTFTFMHWRRKWQPTPVFLPGESQGRGSLVGCHLWGCTESDTTEVT